MGISSDYFYALEKSNRQPIYKSIFTLHLSSTSVCINNFKGTLGFFFHGCSLIF